MAYAVTTCKHGLNSGHAFMCEMCTQCLSTISLLHNDTCRYDYCTVLVYMLMVVMIDPLRCARGIHCEYVHLIVTLN